MSNNLTTVATATTTLIQDIRSCGPFKLKGCRYKDNIGIYEIVRGWGGRLPIRSSFDVLYSGQKELVKIDLTKQSRHADDVRVY